MAITNAKEFIDKARKQGIPDEEIYKYLQSSGAIKGEKQPTTIGNIAQGAVGFAKGIGRSIVDLGKMTVESPMGPLGTMGAVSGLSKKVSSTIFSPYDKALEATNEAQRIGGYIETIAELAVPVGYGVVKNASKLGRVATIIGQKTKGVFTAGKELKAIKSELISQPLKKLNLQESILDLRNSSKTTIGEMTQTFNKTKDVLSRTLSEEAQAQSEAIKPKLKELFSEMTKTYGKGLETAENELANKKTLIGSRDYLSSVIENTVNDAMQRGIPNDNKIIKILGGIKKEIAKLPDTKTTIKELQVFKNKILENISSSVKSGSRFGSEFDDQVGGIFIKNHGQFIGKLSPELTELNKAFAPMANARTWAIRNFKPFNTQEIQRGANVLMKIAKGEVPDKTAMNYFKTLEEGVGEFKGAGNLTGKTVQIGKEIRTAKEAFDLARYNLVKSTDLKIFNLKKEMADLAAKGIEFGQKQKELEGIIKIRNLIIATTIGSIILPPAIKRLLTGGIEIYK